MRATRETVASLVALTAAVLFLHTAHAAAPLVKGQAPGYYRMVHGDFEITALNDGTLALDVKKLLTNTTPVRVDQLLKRAFLADPVLTSVNAFLVNTGSKLVLIDAGTGNLFGPTLGNLVNNLKASGYQPEQVDEIYITHMHGDHVGLSINPYAAAGKFKPFDGSGELMPGISAVSTYGHTKGHTICVSESKGQKMAVLGDLMHVAAVQFPNPSVTIQFDTDPKMAAVQRKKVYADGAKQGFWLAVAHLSFPGIGHIHADGPGYVFHPANYSIPK